MRVEDSVNKKMDTSAVASQGAIVRFPESSLSLEGRSSSSGRTMPLPHVDGSSGIELEGISRVYLISFR